MEAMFFYGPDPMIMGDQINEWLKQFDESHPGMEIIDIKQTTMSPDAIIANVSLMHCDDVIEREAHLVVSIWYDGIKKNKSLKKRIALKN